MATVNNWMTTKAGVTVHGNHAQVPSNVDAPVVRKRYIDSTVTNLASGEFYKLFAVPANCLVRAYAIADVAEGAADTIDVDLVLDSDTTAGSPYVLLNDFSLNQTDTSNVTLVHNSVGFAGAASTVCIVTSAAIATAKFWIVCEMIPLSTTD